MKFTNPKANDSFAITSGAVWPSIAFEADATGSHSWEWTIAWGSFTKSGKEITAANKWDAKTALTNLGGDLKVTARAGNDAASITVKICGTNPRPSEVTQYLAAKADSAGFDKIIGQESKYMHFRASGEPIKSFDNGYGMCQLTTPVPTFEQIWNWKSNIDGGLKLYAQKMKAAVGYLSQSGRSYTKEQLKYEAVCRWNGGAYHEWDAKGGKWIRPANILCDSKTGNIGWNMDDADNQGKTETDLHKRDSGSYSAAPQSGAHWKYSGVCYADHVLG